MMTTACLETNKKNSLDEAWTSCLRLCEVRFKAKSKVDTYSQRLLSSLAVYLTVDSRLVLVLTNLRAGGGLVAALLISADSRFIST
jgi:hypothetical protein